MDYVIENFSVHAFKERLKECQISMAFQGMFSQEILTLLGKSLQNTPDAKNISKRLFALVVEMTQNIHHYSAHKMFSQKDNREIGVGIIAISETEGFYQVSSGNYVSKEDALTILERSHFINSLDENELKLYYKEQRKMPPRPGKPGANLGLIDMRRKSGQKLEVIIEQEADQYFYILTLKVSKSA